MSKEALRIIKYCVLLFSIIQPQLSGAAFLQVSANVSGGGGHTSNITVTDPTSVKVNSIVSLSGTGLGNAEAQADYGVLKALAGTAIVDRCCGMDASASAFSHDELTISNAAYTGQYGLMSGRILLEGNTTVIALANSGGNSSVEWAFVIAGWGSIDGFNRIVDHGVLVTSQGLEIYDANGNLLSPPDGIDSQRPYIPLYFSLPFIFGTPFSLAMEIIVHAITVDTIGVASGDFSHSIYWDGIQSVTINSNSVQYAINSSSGTNYDLSMVPKTAPEPATMLLVTLGIVGFPVYARRKSADKQEQEQKQRQIS
jgi:hypothetical protein